MYISQNCHLYLFCQHDDYIYIVMTSKPRVIFFLGGPGSGKGTHCDILRERFNLLHLSVGDILREFLKSGTKEAN